MRGAQFFREIKSFNKISGRGKIMTEKLKFIGIKKHYQTLVKQWEMYTEPGRPGRVDIKKYNQLTQIALGQKKGAKVVVLGATPEFRDMLYKYYLLSKIKVICVDMMPEMYQAMTELVTVKIPGEKFIHSNWLKMKFPKNSIDLFIGDLVIGNLRSKQERAVFLGNIRRSLKKDGYFITRHWYHTPRMDVPNIKRRLFSYVPKVMSEELTFKQAANHFWCDLLIGSWSKGKQNATSVLFWQEDLRNLTKYFRRRPLTNRDKIAKMIFQYAKKLFTANYWCYFNKKTEMEQIKEFFVIKKTLFAKYSYMSFNSPIYLLKPKK